MRPAVKEAVTPVAAGDVISVTKALAELLAEETGLVAALQISKVGALQDRKLKLVALLERYGRYFSKNPAACAAISAQERAELMVAEERLKKEMHVNYEKLLVARAVNQAIVTCVTGIFAKRAGNELYNASGTMYRSERYHSPVSMTLNKVI